MSWRDHAVVRTEAEVVEWIDDDGEILATGEQVELDGATVVGRALFKGIDKRGQVVRKADCVVLQLADGRRAALHWKRRQGKAGQFVLTVVE